MIRFFFLFVLVFAFIGTSFAKSDPQYKTKVDLYLKAPSLVREPPTRFQPVELDQASEDIEHRLSILPYEQDKNVQRYLVIPQLGLVTPVVILDPNSKDYKTMVKGGQINIDPYLERGVGQYPGGGKLGYIGHNTIFGHSNQYKNAKGDYKTIFASIFSIDPNDQIWLYDKQSDGSYKLFKYNVTQSYLTDPTDVSILLPDGEGSNLNIIGCAYGLKYRWVVKTTLLGDVTDTRTVYGLPSELAKRLDIAIKKIYRLPNDTRKGKVNYLIELLAKAKKITKKTEPQKKLIEYLDYYLPQLLP